MPENIYITGMGIVAAIGNTVEETFHSLNSGNTGIGPINYLNTIHKNEFVAGEIKLSTEELVAMAGIGVQNRTTLAACIAVAEALKNAGIADINEARTGLISSTTVGGITKAEALYKPFFEGKTNENFLDAYLSGDGTNTIAAHFGITDYVTTISTACSSSANAIMLGARLINNNILDRVIVGGADTLSKFTLNGFNSLMILDKEWCKPFDENRKGLNLGEGAAYLVLESEKMVKRMKTTPIARLAAYGNANDAYHQTASSPDGKGAFLAMQKALKSADLKPGEIDYVNAHGTGTANNDASECVAMQNVFGDSMPQFSSTKAFTGHTLAAAAAVEAVISILSMQNGCMFPSLNITEPLSAMSISPITVLRMNETINLTMSNSFGFGGNCSSLIFANA